MKGRERALRALSFQPVDRVALFAGEIESSQTLSMLSGKDYWKSPDQREVAIQAFRNLGIDLIFVLTLPFSPDEELRAWDVKAMFRYGKQRYPDMESVLRRINSLPSPEQVRRTFDSEAAYHIHLARAREQDRLTGDDILWLASGFEVGLCEFAWYLVFGYENFFMLLGAHKDAAHKLFRYSAETGRLRNEAIAAAILENDLPRFVYGGSDFCYNSGLMASPKLLDEIYFPWLAYSLEPLVRAGIGIIWHCDGNVTPIIDRMLAMGVAGFQGFQEDAGVRLDRLVRTRTIKGRRPILLGSVQGRSVLPLGTVDDVKQEVERCINIVGRESGFFLGPSSVIQPEVPVENIKAMYDHAREYGHIPISPWGVKL